MDIGDLIAILLAGGALLTQIARFLRLLRGDSQIDVPPDWIDKYHQHQVNKRKKARSGGVGVFALFIGLAVCLIVLSCGTGVVPDARWVYADVDTSAVVRYDGIVVSEGPGLIYLVTNLPGVLEVEADSLYALFMIGACPGVDTVGVR
jgi:hypothetical protein